MSSSARPSAVIVATAVVTTASTGIGQRRRTATGRVTAAPSAPNQACGNSNRNPCRRRRSNTTHRATMTAAAASSASHCAGVSRSASGGRGPASAFRTVLIFGLTPGIPRQ